MNNQKVVIGLSGGVDSSVAAALLIEQGYEVHGVYLECYNEPGCRTDQDKADALKVALKLGITFEVLDFRKEYREKVVEYFYSEYSDGRTPNPDVMCNREIKFGIFYDWAMEQGYDYVATGHYARIYGDRLKRARDESKDQSYFLWQIPGDHLDHVLFPLGNMLKKDVREKASQLGLHIATKPDSMGICFIGEVNVSELLRDRLGENPGEVVYQGVLVGRHKGLWFYTTGERKGFDLDKTALKKLGLHPEKMGPMYVIGKNIEKNQLIVGSRVETMTSQFKMESKIINSLPAVSTTQALQASQMLKLETKLWVRIRNLGELVPVEKIEGNTVILKEKIFGIAEGQSAVFYDSEGVLVGGAIIV